MSKKTMGSSSSLAVVVFIVITDTIADKTTPVCSATMARTLMIDSRQCENLPMRSARGIGRRDRLSGLFLIVG